MSHCAPALRAYLYNKGKAKITKKDPVDGSIFLLRLNKLFSIFFGLFYLFISLASDDDAKDTRDNKEWVHRNHTKDN